METLLSLSFDNISSKDPAKIRKGLRQIEGLLVQICLSSASTPGHKRRASAFPTSQPSREDASKRLKTLSELPQDPAFREFFRLQDGFEWNVTSKLVDCLERLLGMGESGSSDLLLLSGLTVLQGVLLLHPPSRKLFRRETYMNLVLDLLDVSLPPAVQSAALLVLVTALLGQPQNTRVFEATDGLLTITSLFKSRSTSRAVKVMLLEFLQFYLLPETRGGGGSSQSEPNTGVGLRRRESKLGGGVGAWAGDRGSTTAMGNALLLETGVVRDAAAEEKTRVNTRSPEEKQRLLARYLSNIEYLVQDLREGGPFGVQPPGILAG